MMKRFFFQDFVRLQKLNKYLIQSDENLYYTSLTFLVGIVASMLIEHALFLSENFLLIPFKIFFAVMIIWGIFIGLMAGSLAVSGYKHQRPLSFGHLKRLLRHLFKQNAWIGFGYFLFYTIIAIPLGGFGFSTVILAHLPMNLTLQNFIFAHRWVVAPIFILLYVGLCVIALRLILAIPAMISYECTLREGLQLSWQLTKKRVWRMVSQILVIVVRVSVPLFLGGFVLLATLSQLNKFIHQANVALIFMILAITLTELLFVTWFLVFMTGFLAQLVDWVALAQLPLAKAPVFKNALPNYEKWDIKQIQQIGFALLGLLLLVTPTYAYFSIQRNEHHTQQVVTISHRGVSDRNGVQNTIMALKKTAKLKPDYVEMDIRETRDHQFVVMHDANLSHLAHRNQATCELTLKQLTKLTIRENGYQTKISSFSDYLRTAHRLKQHLIIEIKPSRGDSDDLIQLFARKYARNLSAHGDLVHSLNGTYMQQLKKQAPKVTTGIITPFNIARIPANSADFYSLEFHTLNRQFIQQAWAKGKKVFVWPVDGKAPMKRMLALRVDGIITNHLQRLQSVIRTRNATDLSQYEVLNNLIELW
ncbi:glycerophosphodiester phosphodiesterase family protein [Pediococcus siamensis]|uniref:glycerophosphodiester phosphodiesterase family protein n=1 Tax=Pediococcus siamensis TaxID=381829 RepID=UPI0039A21340